MAPVAVPEMISCRKSAMAFSSSERPQPRGAVAPLTLLDRIDRRQCRRHDLLAADHLDQEALAVEIAVVVEMHVEQHSGDVLDAKGGAVQRLGEGLVSRDTRVAALGLSG